MCIGIIITMKILFWRVKEMSSFSKYYSIFTALIEVHLYATFNGFANETGTV